MSKLKLCFISDTHTFHEQLEENGWLPEPGECDVLCFTGDATFQGWFHNVEKFCKWLDKMQKERFKYVVWVAGNHDITFETEPDKIAELFPKNENIYYLNDNGCEINGFKFWGSPVQPWFHGWAFNRGRGDEIKKHWDLIPEDTDVLLTHGPVFGILDKTMRGPRAGCEELRKAIFDRIKPLIHGCGHIHEDYGQEEHNGIQFVNGSNCNLHYRITNKPIIVEIERNENEKTDTE